MKDNELKEEEEELKERANSRDNLCLFLKFDRIIKQDILYILVLGC